MTDAEPAGAFTVSVFSKRTFDDGADMVRVEVWADGSCGFVACTRLDDVAGGRLVEYHGCLFVDWDVETTRMCLAAIRGEVPPAVLADWVADRREFWRAPGQERERAADAVCSRLRRIDASTVQGAST